MLAAGSVWGVWECWGEVLGGACSEGDRTGVLGEDCGGGAGRRLRRVHHAVPRRPDVSTRRVWLLAVVAGCWLPDVVCHVAWEGMHGGWPQVTLCLFLARPVLMPPPFLRCRPPPPCLSSWNAIVFSSFHAGLVRSDHGVPHHRRPPPPTPLGLTAIGTSL